MRAFAFKLTTDELASRELPMPKIAIATCVNKPEPDPDEALLLEALHERGCEVRLVAWDAANGSNAVGSDEACVIRSTWNYFEDVHRFLAWADSVPRLFNPASIVRNNVRKTYLRDIEASGIPIVPTAWGHPDVATTMRERGWNTVVIKPVVSAGSFSTRRFTLAESAEAQSFLESAGREMMIQPWMAAVDDAGERSLVWIAGTVTHAVRKSPRFAGGHEAVTSVPVADDERAFAARILAPLEPHLLYARVDMIRDGGTLRLMELELVEPSLFLKQHPPALERFANAVAALP